MKMNYTAPEAEILCFRPVEELAGNIYMDDLLKNNFTTGNKGVGAEVSDTDIKIIF